MTSPRATRSVARAAASPEAASPTRAAVRPPSKSEYCSARSGTFVLFGLNGKEPIGVCNVATGFAYWYVSRTAKTGSLGDSASRSRASAAPTAIFAERYPKLFANAKVMASSSERGLAAGCSAASAVREERSSAIEATAMRAAIAGLRTLELLPRGRRRLDGAQGDVLLALEVAVGAGEDDRRALHAERPLEARHGVDGVALAAEDLGIEFDNLAFQHAGKGRRLHDEAAELGERDVGEHRDGLRRRSVGRRRELGAFGTFPCDAGVEQRNREHGEHGRRRHAEDQRPREAAPHRVGGDDDRGEHAGGRREEDRAGPSRGCLDQRVP